MEVYALVYVGSRCIGCAACESICPKNCIQMIQAKDGFAYPAIKQDQCVKCGLCDRICPVNNAEKKINLDIKLNAGYTDDRRILETSSGAIYPQLLDSFFKTYPNGIAYGVRFQNGITEHFELKNGQNYSSAYGSKYTQSDLKVVFSTIRKHLNNTTVFFSGTPCQVAAIKRYVSVRRGGNINGNLITQAVLCHGVASPKVLKKYINYWEERTADKVIGLKFRAKDLSWERYGMKIYFQNRKDVFIESKDDLFHKAFGNNLSLRESCYNCEFKYPNYYADIVLGDFWNAASIQPDIYNQWGTSIVFGVTDEGKKLLQPIIACGHFDDVTIKQALQSQKGIIQPTSRPKKRDRFFEDLDQMDFALCIKKYTKMPLLRQIRILIGKGYRGMQAYAKKW